MALNHLFLPLIFPNYRLPNWPVCCSPFLVGRIYESDEKKLHVQNLFLFDDCF